MKCPKCGREQEDLDGFGFLACVPGCGYCTHPSRYGGECSICGDVQAPEPDWEERAPDHWTADDGGILW